MDIKKEIEKNGFNPDDFVINVTEEGYSYYPKFDLDIRKAFEVEDYKVKEEIEYDSATGMFELLTLSETNIEKLENEISKSDFEVLTMISQLSTKIQELEKKIKELTK